MALRDLVLATRAADRRPLLAVIEEALTRRALQSRRPDDGVWHASVISSGICPRQAVLNAHLPKYRQETDPPSPATQRIFDEGTMRHEFFQTEVLGPAGVLWGYWEHPLTKEVRSGFQPPAVPIMGFITPDGRKLQDKLAYTLNWRYKELRLFNPELNLGGATDGVLVFGKGHSAKLSLLEIKSCNSRTFSLLGKPMEKHIRQVECYMNCDIQSGEFYSEFGTRRVTETTFLYVCKDDSALKEFSVKSDAGLFDEVAAPLLDYKKSLLDHRLPVKLGECLRANSVRAKTCNCRVPCFSVGNAAAGWQEMISLRESK